MLIFLNIKNFKEFLSRMSIFSLVFALTATFFFAFQVCAAAQGDSGLRQGNQTYTLNQLLHIAVQYHPLLKEAEGVIQQEKGLEGEAYSSYFPQINFQSSYERANALGGLFGATIPFTVYDTGGTLSQLITDFGHTGALVRASKESLLESQENYNSTLQQILFNVYQAYYQILENHADLKVQESSVTDLKKHLGQAEGFYRVGTQPKIDVTQAEVNLTNGEYALVQAENSLDIAWTNLAAAVGKPNLKRFKINDQLKFENYPMTLQKALETAYHVRPDFLALEAEVKAQKANLEAVSKQNYPVLSGSAGYGWRNSFFPPGTAFWNLGVNLNFPLFDGFKETSQIQTAKGVVDQIQAELDNLKLTIHQAVQQAFLNLKASRTNLKVAAAGLKYAAENFHLADGSYRVGTANYLQYEDAEVALVQAKTNYIQALANYNIDVASLKQAMGVLKQ